MRFSLAVGVLVFLHLACSNDSEGGGGGDDAGSGGSSGSGGAVTGGTSGAGGTAGNGGLNTGGTDPTLCSIDSGQNECLLCLARYCCDAIEGCLGDTTCKAEFDKQQQCEPRDGGVDRSACYSAFLRTSADGGPNTRPVAECILVSCGAVCGGPGIF